MEEKPGRSERSENIMERERRAVPKEKIKRSENIRAESEKSSMYQSISSSLVQNDV